jgi:predicted AAA+ superfamily ATPase
MWIERDIQGLIADRAQQRPVLVLTGARQTGKTSLVRRMFPDHEFVSLDLPSEADQAERDPVAFLTRHPPPLIVDEVQYAPGFFRHLKVVVDAHRTVNGQFILTGSQRFTLMESVAESLAGRTDVIELEPLSWREVRRAVPATTIEAFMLRGGFPELHARPEIDADGFYRSYVATYLERDLRPLLRVSQLRDYERFLRICALRSGQLLNRADLARDVGISGSTAGAWLSVLQTTGEIVLLEPWFSNRTKSLVKTPKLYLGDSGLCSFLCGLRSVSDLATSPLAGALWETLVCSEIRRGQINRRGGWSFSFWRDRSREVDFLFHRGGRFDLADAKWTEHPEQRDADALRRVASELPSSSVDRTAVICRCAHTYPVSPTVNAVPLHDLPEDWR